LQIRDLHDACEIRKERFDEFAGHADDDHHSVAFPTVAEEEDSVASAAAQKNGPTPTKHEPAQLVTTGKEVGIGPKQQRHAAAQLKVGLSKSNSESITPGPGDNDDEDYGMATVENDLKRQRR
jgi:hypothetical protein